MQKFTNGIHFMAYKALLLHIIKSKILLNISSRGCDYEWTGVLINKITFPWEMHSPRPTASSDKLKKRKIYNLITGAKISLNERWTVGYYASRCNTGVVTIIIYRHFMATFILSLSTHKALRTWEFILKRLKLRTNRAISRTILMHVVMFYYKLH